MISDRDAVGRLLRRVGLGPRPGEPQAAAAAGFEATLAGLTRANGADPGADATPAPDLGPAQPRPGKAAAAEEKRARRRAEAEGAVTLIGWWLDRMTAVEQPFRERMAWFWHGHFATSAFKVKSAPLMYTQNDTLRRLGRRGLGYRRARAPSPDRSVATRRRRAGDADPVRRQRRAEHGDPGLGRRISERETGAGLLRGRRAPAW